MNTEYINKGITSRLRTFSGEPKVEDSPWRATAQELRIADFELRIERQGTTAKATSRQMTKDK
jgi:hypothetical protein